MDNLFWVDIFSITASVVNDFFNITFWVDNADRMFARFAKNVKSRRNLTKGRGILLGSVKKPARRLRRELDCTGVF